MAQPFHVDSVGFGRGWVLGVCLVGYMTLCRERKQSLVNAREFLYELAQPGPQLTKKELRHRIKYILKHWPWPSEVAFLPDIPSEAARVCFSILKQIEAGRLDQDQIEVVITSPESKEAPEDTDEFQARQPNKRKAKSKGQPRSGE